MRDLNRQTDAEGVAKLAGVPVDDVLSGAWPSPGMCPMCGRSA